MLASIFKQDIPLRDEVWVHSLPRAAQGQGMHFRHQCPKEEERRREHHPLVQPSLLSRRKAFSLNTTPSRWPCYSSLVRSKSYAHPATNHWQRTWDYHVGPDKPASPDTGSLRPEQNQGIVNKGKGRMLSDNEKCLPQLYFLYWRSKRLAQLDVSRKVIALFFPK